MFLKCDIEVNYRLQSSQKPRGPSRKCHGAVGLYRRSGEEHKRNQFNYNIVVFTSKSKNGVKYRVSKFLNEVAPHGRACF